MTQKNDTTVLIGGNVYTLAGSESEEYIQRVALYINNKLEEIKKSENAKKLNTRLMSILLEINIADDYFKAKEKYEEIEKLLLVKDEKINSLEKELNDIKGKLNDFNNEKLIYNQTIEALKTEVNNYKTELEEYIDIFDHDR